MGRVLYVFYHVVGFFLIPFGFLLVSIGGFIYGMIWFFSTFSSGIGIALGIALSFLSVTLYLALVVNVSPYYIREAMRFSLFGSYAFLAFWKYRNYSVP